MFPEPQYLLFIPSWVVLRPPIVAIVSASTFSYGFTYFACTRELRSTEGIVGSVPSSFTVTFVMLVQRYPPEIPIGLSKICVW